MSAWQCQQTARRAEVEDTYAEAFRSIYAEVLITARDRTLARPRRARPRPATPRAPSCAIARRASTATSGPGGDESFATPDGRPGAVVQFHVPRFRKDRAAALERSLLTRISQNVLTCPTAACFNLLDTDPYFKLGRKIAFFRRRLSVSATSRFGRPVWVVPILGGEFVLDRRFGYRDGLMGGNLWFMGRDENAALLAAGARPTPPAAAPGVITPFPGGVAASGSKAGSRYKFAIASTYEKFCPTLPSSAGRSKLPPGVGSIMEIIINGRDLATIAQATQAAIAAAVDTPGLVKISAGNYGGRLGKSFIYLHPDRHAAPQGLKPSAPP